MFLKSQEDERTPIKKKYHFDPIKVIIGMAIGFVTPEVAGFLSENVIETNTLNNIANVSPIGLAVIFGLVALFLTFQVERIYEEDIEKDRNKQVSKGVQNEVTDKLAEYQAAKKAGDTDRMKEIEVWLKAHKVTLKK